MWAKIILTTSIFMLTQLVNAQSSLQRKKNYTVPEVKEWAEKNKTYPNVDATKDFAKIKDVL